LEFNVPFQHKYGYIRDEASVTDSEELLATANVSLSVRRLNYYT